MSLSERALQYATEAHSSIDQKRLGGVEDYIIHPIAVANLVKSVMNDEQIIASAYLHDVIEDVFPKNPKYNPQDILDKFGVGVLTLVLELTNVYTKEKYPQFNRKKRKELENQRIKTISNEAKTVKLADIIDNCKGSKYDIGFVKVYRNEKRDQLMYLVGGNETLYAKAVETVNL